MNVGPSYQKAASLHTSKEAYCRHLGKAKTADWEVVDADTGETMTLTNAQFKARYVSLWELPPHMRHIVDEAPSWWDWKASRGRA